MNRKKQTYALLSAGTAWAAALGIALGAPFVDLAHEHPWTVSRIFALCALAATVITMGLLIIRSRRPAIPVPAKTAYELGFEAGKELGRLEAQFSSWNAPDSEIERIMDSRGPRDTSPFGWRQH